LGKGAGGLEGLVEQTSVFLNVVAKQPAGLPRRPPQPQAVAEPVPIKPDEKLDVVALAALVAPIERDPQDGLIGDRTAIVILANAGQSPAAPGHRLQVPAALLSQDRLDVPIDQGLTQFHERFAHGKAITVALVAHPLPAVVVLQLRQKTEGVGTETLKKRREDAKARGYGDNRQAATARRLRVGFSSPGQSGEYGRD